MPDPLGFLDVMIHYNLFQNRILFLFQHRYTIKLTLLTLSSKFSVAKLTSGYKYADCRYCDCIAGKYKNLLFSSSQVIQLGLSINIVSTIYFMPPPPTPHWLM